MVAREAQLLVDGVRRFHGDAMLWLGPVPFEHGELGRCMVRQRVFGALQPEAATDPTTATYLGSMEALPFAPASLDAVVLHHALDCAMDSRLAMAEVVRTIRPGGRLLLCGFNPYSLWGIRRLWSQLREDAFSGVRFISPLRLLDWLAVLGLECDEPVRYVAYRPLLRSLGTDDPRVARSRERLARWQIPFGGVYVILAQKRAAAGIRTPEPRSHRIQRPSLVPAPLPKPTARDSG